MFQTLHDWSSTLLSLSLKEKREEGRGGREEGERDYAILVFFHMDFGALVDFFFLFFFFFGFFIFFLYV